LTQHSNVDCLLKIYHELLQIDYKMYKFVKEFFKDLVIEGSNLGTECSSGETDTVAILNAETNVRNSQECTTTSGKNIC
jgi:hypothetical protein